MTWRLLGVLLDQLPPQSRTKTAMTNTVDPVLLAQFSQQQTGRGWGPHSYTDDLICRVGEAIDRLAWTLIKVNGGTPKDPAPWRRPGVLSALDEAEHLLERGRPHIEQLERERAEREQRRRELRAAEKVADPLQPPPD